MLKLLESVETRRVCICVTLTRRSSLPVCQDSPLAMSSPDREVESRQQTSNANRKDDDVDVDVEMADDDPVTDLFGGSSTGGRRMEIRPHDSK